MDGLIELRDPHPPARRGAAVEVEAIHTAIGEARALADRLATLRAPSGNSHALRLARALMLEVVDLLASS